MQFLEDRIDFIFFSFWSILYDSLLLKIVSILCLQLYFYHGCHGLRTSNSGSKESEGWNSIYGRPRWDSETNYGNQKYCWGKNNFAITREIKEKTCYKEIILDTSRLLLSIQMVLQLNQLWKIHYLSRYVVHFLSIQL